MSVINIFMFFILNQKLYRLVQKIFISSSCNLGRETNNIFFPRCKYGRIISVSINIAFVFFTRQSRLIINSKWIVSESQSIQFRFSYNRFVHIRKRRGFFMTRFGRSSFSVIKTLGVDLEGGKEVRVRLRNKKLDELTCALR